MEPKEEDLGTSNEDSLNFNEAFGTCLSRKEYGTFECANRATLDVLRSFNQQDELNFGSLRLERADGYGRELLDLDYDPRSFENVVKAAVRLMERRSMKWDLDYLYPGLQMRVGPMLNANGLLEFVLNERPPPFLVDRQSGTAKNRTSFWPLASINRISLHGNLPLESCLSTDTNPAFFPSLVWFVSVLNSPRLTHELLSRSTYSRQHGQGQRVVRTLKRVPPFTGRQLTKHLLLPFLLGFKFNLVSLIPLLFGLLLIVSKKALLLTKVALFISGLLGWNNLYNGSPNPHTSIFHGFTNGYGHPYEGHVTGDHPFHDQYHHHHNLQYRPFRVPTNVEFSPYDRHVIREVVDVYDSSDRADESTRDRKNFAWTRRALEILDTAIDDDSVYTLNDFISIGRDPTSTARSSRAMKIPVNGTEKSLDEQLDNKFHEYLSSRSIRLTIPGDTFEGRKKKDKGYGGIMLAGLAMAGMLAQLAYGKIAFLAGTALLTAKIALVLSAIIGLKKLVSSGGGGHEVIYATASEHHGGYGGGGGGGGGGYGGGWQRALDGIPPT
ncbi:hypothetical protein KPH14_007602 [Odynerus spinipes]|uniref:Osiris 10 n=1 Tax=Odynerus spinipes TaxID=1348599 RepID=A0AAD9RHP9_9HYME|nr:hypothetical protein KPH14_007602 [Odynerus spinipes]